MELNMKLKKPEEIMLELRTRYLSKTDNVYHLERYFVACSVIRWIFGTTDKSEEILGYLAQVERHMNGEIDLFWDEGSIKVGKPKKDKS
jgi:hypothetical protein